MLRAYALYVALLISLMVALICGALLTIFYLNDKEYFLYETDYRLRNNVESAFNYVRENEIKEGVNTIDLFKENKDSVQLSIRNWGLLNLISAKAFSGSRLKSKSALMGPLLHSKDEYALYMGNSNKSLYLCGTTNLKGKCFIPEAGVKRAYIEGQNFIGDKLINGEEKISASSLPELKLESIQSIANYLKGEMQQGDSLVAFNKDSLLAYQSFSKNAVVIKSAAPITLSEIQLKGKIIVHSSQWVSIQKSAVLEDILVFAPVVIIEDNFVGSGQFFASDSMAVGKACNFLYPSVLGTVRMGETNKSVFLQVGEQTKLKGSIVCFQEKQTIRNVNFLSLLKGVEVYGQVYSNGYLELQGSIFGTAICSKFILRTPSSVYENHLLNAQIDISQLPAKYIGTNLLNDQKKYDIIKWLN